MSLRAKIIIVSIFAAAGFLVFFTPGLSRRFLFPSWLVSTVREFLEENQLYACDYKDGMIILVKPVATGAGEGRYEAGDIVEIRDGASLCERFGESDFLGDSERTRLLPLYYPKKLTEEEKHLLMAPEYQSDEVQLSAEVEPRKPKQMIKRRQYGLDYTQVLSSREVLKVRRFEKLDKLPEIELRHIIEKNSGLSFNDSDLIFSNDSQFANNTFFFNKGEKSQNDFDNFQTVHLFNNDNNDTGTPGNVKAENISKTPVKSKQNSLVFNSEVENSLIGDSDQISFFGGDNINMPSFNGGNKVAMNTFVGKNFKHEEKNELSDADSGLEFKNLFFGNGPGGISQGHLDILSGNIGILLGDFFNTISSFQKIQNISNSNSSSFYTRFSKSDFLFNDDSFHMNDYNAVEIKSNTPSSVIKLPFHLALYERFDNGIRNIARRLIPDVYAQTESVKTVDTGGYSDYLSLNAWEAGEQANLVTANQIAVAKLRHRTATSTADTAAVDIIGWTTDATRYIKIWTDPDEGERHSGVWDTGKYILNRTSSDIMQNALIVEEAYTRIEGLQIQITISGGQNSSAFNFASGATAQELKADSNLVKCSGSGGDVAGIGDTWGGGAIDIAGDIYILNNIVYDCTGTTNYGIRVINHTSGKTYLYNNTVYNNTNGVGDGYSDIVAKNNIVYNNTDNYAGAFDGSSSYNLSGPTQTDAPGSNSRNGVGVLFADEANDDFHLAYSDTAAKDQGAGLLNDPNLAFNDDIDGQKRGDDWDIGADEHFGPKMVMDPSQKGRWTDGLVGYWTMDGPDMYQNVADVSGNGNHGFMNNFTSTSTAVAVGKVGQALEFDGVNDEIDCGWSTSLNITDLLTISLWLKGNSAATFQYLVSAYGSGNNNQYGFYLSGGVLAFDRYTPTGGQVYGQTVNDGIWHHVAVVFDDLADSVIFYKDGAAESEIYTETYTGGEPNKLAIGSDAYGTTRNFNGLIDEVRIYNRALSAAEILEIYNAGAASHSMKVNQPLKNWLTNGLVGYWTMDGQDMYQNVADVSGNGNHGFMNNFTSTSTAVAVGKIGQALNFDGSNDHVEAFGVNDDINTAAGTISAWIYRSFVDTATPAKHIFRANVNSGNYIILQFNAATDEWWAVYKAGGVGKVAKTAVSDIPQNTWGHIVGTWDTAADNLEIFINGVSKNSIGSLGTWVGAIDASTIGAHNFNSNYWEGSLDEVRIYNRALSQDEITELYNMGMRKAQF